MCLLCMYYEYIKPNTLVGRVYSLSIFSPLHSDISRHVMEEHTVIHQNTTQCNSILPVISKKSPLPNASPPGFQENSLFPGKTLTDTHTHTYTNDSLSIPLSLSTESAPHSPFLSFSLFLSVNSQSCFPLFHSLFLFLSAPYPPPFSVCLVKPV